MNVSSAQSARASSPARVLMLGKTVTNYTHPIASACPEGWLIDALALSEGELFRTTPARHAAFNRYVSGKDLPLGTWQHSKVRVALALLGGQFWSAWRRRRAIARLAPEYPKAWAFKDSLRHAVCRAALERFMAPYDLVNLHFVGVESIWLLDYVRPETKVAVSFWGSDLMQFSGNWLYAEQLRACERADLITLHSLDMREIFLSKFGRRFYDKVRVTLLPNDPQVYRDLAAMDVEAAKRSFRGEYGIGAERKVVMVGHNAASINNHLPMLEELGKLPQADKDRMALVLHMAYSDYDQDYVAAVREKAEAVGAQAVFIDRFFGHEEKLRLRAATDLMLMMHSSDALSYTLGETLYAGNLAIVGAWLPYGPFRRGGVRFLEARSFAELRELAPYALAHYDRLKAEAAGNRQALDAVFAPERTAEHWYKLFGELLPSGPAFGR